MAKYFYFDEALIVLENSKELIDKDDILISLTNQLAENTQKTDL